MGLLHDLDDGEKREITEEEFDYFLEAAPPVAIRFWNGERWNFGFAEGYDHVYAFKKEGGLYFAQKTSLMIPSECNHTLEEQLQTPGFADRLTAEKEATRTASWIPTWLEIGRKNAWIRHAGDPPFTTQSFHPCVSDDELLDKFQHGNWCLGQAFWLGDLCFINQSNGGDEWLTIKQDTPFESISFGHIIAKEGRQAAQALLDRLRVALIEKCKQFKY